MNLESVVEQMEAQIKQLIAANMRLKRELSELAEGLPAQRFFFFAIGLFVAVLVETIARSI